MRYGYIRVSSKDQNIGRQVVALRKYKISENNIYIDKSTGADFDRKFYQEMLMKLKKDDEIYITSLDRLGRNYDEIINQWNIITKKIEANIVVLDFPLLNTKNQINSLTGKFLLDIVLQTLSYVAEIERDNIKQRQSEGIRIAKKKGVKFGRPKIEQPETFEKAYFDYINGKISLRDGGKYLGVSHVTFSKWVKERQVL